MYMQHLENILADTTKRTEKVTLQGKRRMLLKADTILLGALMFDLLEPARELSLKSQEQDIDLISMVDVTDSTRKKYQRLLTKVTDDPEIICQFPRLKEVMSKFRIFLVLRRRKHQLLINTKT